MVCQEDGVLRPTGNGFTCDYSQTDSIRLQQLQRSSDEAGASIDWCGQGDNPCGSQGQCVSRDIGYECKFTPTRSTETTADAPENMSFVSESELRRSRIVKPPPSPSPTCCKIAPACQKIPFIQFNWCRLGNWRGLWGATSWAEGWGCSPFLVWLLALTLVTFIIILIVVVARRWSGGYYAHDTSYDG